MKTFAVQVFSIAFLMLFGVIIFYPVSLSRPTDKKKTGKGCLYCHQKYDSKDLTEAGKYYKQKGSLEGYKEK